MSKLDKFIEELENGTITDFTTHLEQSPTSFRDAMAERGIEIDALIENGEPSVISILISKGYATEHYEDWKTHPDGRVRGALALEGYWPDVFIKDKKSTVRTSVARTYNEYIPQILNRTESEWYCALRLIEKKLDMPLEILKLFLDTKESKRERNQSYVKPIQLRYDALAKEVTLLESTMSPYDLFVMGNPLWVKGVQTDVVSEILNGYKLAETHNQIDLFKSAFSALCQATYWGDYNRIADQYGLKRYTILT